MRRVVFCLMFVVVTGSASAASFNCVKAANPEENFICADPVLTVADEQLAAAYHEHLGRLSEGARAHVVDGQRLWNQWWPTACSGSEQTIDLNRAELDCARYQYRVRLTQLRAPTILGVPVYYRAKFVAGTATRMPDSGDVSRRVLHSMQIAQFDRGGLEERALELIDTINVWLGRELANWETVSSDMQSDTDSRTTVQRISPLLLMATESNIFYGHGAAHELYGESARYFMLSDRRQLNLSDFFADDAFVRAAGDHVYAELLTRWGEETLRIFVKDQSEIDESIRDVGHWRLGRDGLTIFFNIYEVASFAEGPQTVTVPWPVIATFATLFGQEQIRAMTEAPSDPTTE